MDDCGHCTNLLTSHLALLGKDTTHLSPFSTSFSKYNVSSTASSTTSSRSLQSMKAGTDFSKVGKWHPPKWHEGTKIYALQKKNWDTTLLLPLTETKHGECTVWGWILLLPFQCLCPKHLKNEFAFSDRFPVSVVQKVPLLSNPLESNQLSSVLPQLLIKTLLSDLLGEPKPLTGSIWPTSMDVSETTCNQILGNNSSTRKYVGY